MKLIKGFSEFINETLDNSTEDELRSMGFPVISEWRASMPIDFDYILQYTPDEVKEIFMNETSQLIISTRYSIEIELDSVEIDDWSESDVFINGEDHEDGLNYDFEASIRFRLKTDITDEAELGRVLTNEFPQNVFMGVDELSKLD